MSNNSSKTSESRKNSVSDKKSHKKAKNKKSFITSFSHKIQKKVTKSIVKNFVESNKINTSTKLLKSHAEFEDKDVLTSDKIKNLESSRSRRLREIQDRKKKEEELENKKNKSPIILPVPPRFSSNIPERGSSSNYDVNYYNDNLFENYSLSQSLPSSINNTMDENINEKDGKLLSVKRSLSDITPSASNSNSETSTVVAPQAKTSIIQDSNNTSDKPNNDNNDLNHNSSTSQEKIKLKEIDKAELGYSSDKTLNEEGVDQSEKFFFDEKRKKTVNNKDTIFKRESELYMDQQLVDLCSTYYKDYYYENEEEEEEEEEENESTEEESSENIEGNEDTEGIEEYIQSNDYAENNVHGPDLKNNFNLFEDGEVSPTDHTNVGRSNSTSSYFMLNKDATCTITKSNTLPVMDYKHISPKIITCPPDDPDKPITHLVNISGVTIETNDLSHLFWVPSYLHPELHPQEFKKWMKYDTVEQDNRFGRRNSIRRTKSYAESARVITPESTSENGEPVVDPIQRHKTFDTFQNLKRTNNNLKRYKNLHLKKSSEDISILPQQMPNKEATLLNLPENTIHSKVDIPDTIVEEEVTLDTDISTMIDHRDHPTHDIDQNISDSFTTQSTNDSYDLSLSYPNDLNLDLTLTLTDDINPTETIKDSSSSSDTIEEPQDPSLKINQSLTTNTTSSPTSSIPSLTTYVPFYSSSLHNSSSIADGSAESKDSLSDTKSTDTENPPLVGMPDAIYAYKDNEIPPSKSGWSMWWSSFGKDDKKEKISEGSKKNKKSTNISGKSPFSFFKYARNSSSTSLADKNRNYRQGKGITKAYLIDEPLIFKPLDRTTEDTIYSISHTKLATTYRPMMQQVFINNLMQSYIRKYEDAAYKIPFKTARPPKKRRAPLKQRQILMNHTNNLNTPGASPVKPKPRPKPKQKAKRNSLPSTPMIHIPKTNETKTASSTRSSRKKTRLVEVDNSKLDELLERGIEFDNIVTHKPKRRSKIKDDGSNGNAVYKNLNHSISMDQLEYFNSNSHSSSSDLLINNDHHRSSSSSSSLNHFHYFNNNDYDNDDDEEEDDDDEIPLAILQNRRASIITI